MIFCSALVWSGLVWSGLISPVLAALGRAVDGELVDGHSMHGGHQALHDAEAVVQHLQELRICTHTQSTLGGFRKTAEGMCGVFV